MTEERKKSSGISLAKNAREVAWEVLYHIFRHQEESIPVPVLLNEKTCFLKAQDISLTSELVYGVLRRFTFLDFALSTKLRRPDSLSPQLSMLLRLGSFELLFLNGIPERATLSEFTKLARRRYGERMSGLVNAILRVLAREKDILIKKYNSPEKDFASLSEKCSLPLWLLELWQRQYGTEQAVVFAQNTRTAPAPCWRVNGSCAESREVLQSWTNRGYVKIGETGFSSFGLSKKRERETEERALLDAQEKAGLLTRQGASSQILVADVARLIKDSPALNGVQLWDACCGRGGKSMALLELGIKVALASDPSPFRLEEFKKGIRRLNLPAPQLLCSPAQKIRSKFYLILLDVPCSGTGTLGRVPELRLRLNMKKLQDAVCLQKDILEGVWKKLNAGGLLFYSTCAVNKEENEGQIEKFFQTHRDAEPFFHKQYLPCFPGQDIMFLSVIKKSS